MQSSESAGLPANTIEDPKVSIKQGVKHFHQVVTYGKEKMSTSLQSFKPIIWDSEYISFISENGGKHSEKLAKEFSMIQVVKNPKVYDCGGNQENFRYPYCYGDFSYSTKVIKNIDLMTADTK